jgi:hypothetical protein
MLHSVLEKGREKQFFSIQSTFASLNAQFTLIKGQYHLLLLFTIFRDLFDKEGVGDSKPIPSHVYRIKLPTTVTLSPNDRAHQVFTLLDFGATTQ